MISSKCVMCESKQFRFIKDQARSGLTSIIGIKAGLDEVPIFGPIFFKGIEWTK